MDYIKNVVWKHSERLTPGQWQTILSSSQHATNIAAVRATEDKAMRDALKRDTLPAFSPHGECDQALYNHYQQMCTEQGLGQRPRLGRRNTAFLQPTGLLMMDFDRDSEEARRLYELFCEKVCREQHRPIADYLALAYTSANGKGLHLILKRTPGLTIEEEQRHIAALMGEEYDTACADMARVSYMPAEADIFYRNDALLFAPHMGMEFINPEKWNGKLPLPIKGGWHGTQETNESVELPFAKVDHSQVHSINYPQLAEALVGNVEFYMGEVIRKGNRNRCYYNMARQLYALLGDYALVVKVLVYINANYGHNFPLKEIHHVVRSVTSKSTHYIPTYLVKHINEGHYYVSRCA